VGVFGEPLVLGADTMMTTLRELQVGPGRDPFRVVFSGRPFPGAIAATRLDEDAGGVWYRAEVGGATLEGWLCGHLYDYFAEAPETLHVRAEALP
jgi:hypothetical protein